MPCAPSVPNAISLIAPNGQHGRRSRSRSEDAPRCNHSNRCGRHQPSCLRNTDFFSTHSTFGGCFFDAFCQQWCIFPTQPRSSTPPPSPKHPTQPAHKPSPLIMRRVAPIERPPKTAPVARPKSQSPRRARTNAGTTAGHRVPPSPKPLPQKGVLRCLSPAMPRRSPNRN